MTKNSFGSGLNSCSFAAELGFNFFENVKVFITVLKNNFSFAGTVLANEKLFKFYHNKLKVN